MQMLKKIQMNLLCGAILSLFLSLGVVGCQSGSQDAAPVLAEVSVRTARLEPVSDVYRYPARIYAKIRSSILAENDGIVTRIDTELGQEVTPHQALLVIKHTDPVYQYAPVQVRSPIQGVVSSIEVDEGSHVLQGQKLATVINPKQLEVQIEVPAQEIAVLKQEKKGELFITGMKVPLELEVLGVSPFVDPTTGTALVQLKFKKSHAHFSHVMPGVQGQVVVQAKTHPGILIADAAVAYPGKDLLSPFVRIVEGGKIKKVPVILGKRQRGWVEVTQGIIPGMDWVIRSNRFVAEGEAVAVTKDDQP